MLPFNARVTIKSMMGNTIISFTITFTITGSYRKFTLLEISKLKGKRPILFLQEKTQQQRQGASAASGG
jgi:hypothetical protein